MSQVYKHEIPYQNHIDKKWYIPLQALQKRHKTPHDIFTLCNLKYGDSMVLDLCAHKEYLKEINFLKMSGFLLCRKALVVDPIGNIPSWFSGKRYNLRGKRFGSWQISTYLVKSVVLKKGLGDRLIFWADLQIVTPFGLGWVGDFTEMGCSDFSGPLTLIWNILGWVGQLQSENVRIYKSVQNIGRSLI